MRARERRCCSRSWRERSVIAWSRGPIFETSLLHLSAGETDLEPLLPDRWAANHPEHILQHRLDESRRKAARKRESRQRRRAIVGRRRKGH